VKEGQKAGNIRSPVDGMKIYRWENKRRTNQRKPKVIIIMTGNGQSVSQSVRLEE